MNRNIFKKISILVLFLVATLFLAINFNADAASVGKTPTGISVTYYDDIDSRGFAWQTSKEITESNLLVVKDEGQTVNWNSVTPIKGTYKDFYDSGYRCHKAQVTDLAAGNYLYKVGGNNVYSEVGKFTIDNSNDNKVSFTYVTDSQETSVAGFENFNKTLTTAVKYNPNFIAFAGDLVDNSHAGWSDDYSKIVMEEWSYAFDTTKSVTMNYPMMSASGNHERGGFSFVEHNNIDYDKALSTGGYYSFDYENVHFTVLDTNVFEDGNQPEIDAQLAWLEEDLANTDKAWKIVMMHIGVYSTGDHSNDSSVKKIRDILPPILSKHKVDLVLQGHDHVYTRTMPYLYGEGENGKVVNRNEKFVKEDGINWSLEPDGTYYITINYAGTKNYPPVDYDTSRIFPGVSPVNGKVMSQEVKDRMFAHIEIDGNKLLLKSYLAKDDGSDELYDYVAIKKNTYTAAVDAIDALKDTVTVDDAPKLKSASDLYNGLSERALAYVPAEKVEKLNKLLSSFNLKDGLAAYDVIQLIKKIDTKTYGDTFWTDYSAANEGYYNLTEEQKELVYNKDVLANTKANLAQIKEETTRKYLVEGVQKLVDNIQNAENKEEARLLAKSAYDLLDDTSKALIKNAEILDQPIEEKGCNGSIYASLTSIILLGCMVVLIRRKRGVYDEEN